MSEPPAHRQNQRHEPTKRRCSPAKSGADKPSHSPERRDGVLREHAISVHNVQRVQHAEKIEQLGRAQAVRQLRRSKSLSISTARLTPKLRLCRGHARLANRRKEADAVRTEGKCIQEPCTHLPATSATPRVNQSQGRQQPARQSTNAHRRHGTPRQQATRRDDATCSEWLTC
jgi:hypothetical protein